MSDQTPKVERKCTYVDCRENGIGRVAETSGHWLCENHLKAIKDAIEKWRTSGDRSDMKKMLGMTVRAAGGAEAMTDRILGKRKADAHLEGGPEAGQ